MKTNSKDYPTIKRLQGKILVPTNITLATNEDGEESYNYWQISFPLTSKLSNAELIAEANKEYAKLSQIETLEAGCPTSLGFRIDCMDKNKTDFDQTLGLISIYSAMTEVLVRDYDNLNHTITVDQYKQMCLELGAHVMAVRQVYWADIDAL
jgi:hypothetical protein